MSVPDPKASPVTRAQFNDLGPNAAAGAGQAQAPKATKTNASPGELVDRVGNTGFVQIHAESFRSLTPREKELAYWLTEAAIAIATAPPAQ